MSLESVIAFLFDPRTAVSFITGAGLAFSAAAWAASHIAKIRQEKTDFIQHKLEQEIKNLSTEREAQANKHAQSETEISNYKAKIEELTATLKTVRCSICGHSMKRVKQYTYRPANGWGGEFEKVDIQCVGESCGQIMTFNLHELQELTKKVSI